jgi:hypothetical protein
MGRDVRHPGRRSARVLADGPVSLLETERLEVVPAHRAAADLACCADPAVPADASVEHKLRKLRPGQIVHLSGYLVDVRGPGGFTWNTSLRRDDTGAGACEIMWIESVALE